MFIVVHSPHRTARMLTLGLFVVLVLNRQLWMLNRQLWSMPFFQGSYNFELHGGSFRGSRHHRRRHHAKTKQLQTIPLAQRIPHRSESLLEDADSKVSENTTDEEAHALPRSSSCRDSILAFLADTLSSQIYMPFFLYLPSHYFNRVDRLSRDANMALKEILDLAVELNVTCGNDFQTKILDLGQHSSPSIVDPESLPPAYRQLTIRWSCFIDDLLEEWRTLNIVSALLVPWVIYYYQNEKWLKYMPAVYWPCSR